MTIVTNRIFTLYNGTVWFEFTYDSPMIVEEDAGPVVGDPNATDLVSAVAYQNLSSFNFEATVGNRRYTIQSGTQATTINIPKGQQFRLDSAPLITINRV